MRRHAKASSAGSTKRQGASLGSRIRGALVTRGSTSDADGSGAPSGRLRLALLALTVGAFFAVPASQAAADTLTVTLSGSETGTVISSPPGIECSDTPGAEKLSEADCTHEFGFFIKVSLEAVPDGTAVLGGWTGNTADFPPEFPSTCNSGIANPCSFTSLFFTPTVDASFEPPPPPPVATTGGTSQVGYRQATLEGAVNPEGSKPSSCKFEYGLSTEYEETVPCTPAELGEGSADVAVSAKTGALDPSATYHYRLVAANPGGTSRGEDRTFTTEAAPPDVCPNAAIRAEQGIRAIDLPECMALEMASPPVKYNQNASSSLLSASGDRLEFESVAALETPRQGFINEKYLASRTASGWKTSPTAPPVRYAVGYGGSGQPCAYSPDLSRWATFASTETQARVGIVTALQSSMGGPFSALSPTIAPTLVPSTPNQFAVGEGACEGSSADADHLFFKISGAYTYLPGDPDLGGSSNTYEAYLNEEGAPSVRLLQRDGNGAVVGGSCEARIGGPIEGESHDERGAISPDGQRVYFTTRPSQAAGEACNTTLNKLRIMKRVETPEGPWISEPIHSECTRVSPACSTADGNDHFQGASQEGTKVLFTTTRQLANADLDTGSQCGANVAEPTGCDLYLYDASQPYGERLTDISAGGAGDPTPGKGAEVLGVVDMGGNASHVYFAARGVLTTTPNAEGQSAAAGEPNLYLYERDAEYPEGRTVFVGTLSSEDSALWQKGPEGPLAMAVPLLGPNPEDQSVGGSGETLVLITAASLSADDTDGGQPDVYRFDSKTGAIERISKAAPEGSDNGPFSVSEGNWSNTLGPQQASFGRMASEDGKTIVFSTPEALDPSDVNGTENAYLWHDGTLNAMPYAFKPQVSMSGEEVTFTSYARLLPQDGDGASDVYVARADGGFAPEPPKVPCEGEACQEPFHPPAAAKAPASSSFNGPGNVKPVPTRQCPKGKRKVHAKGKVRCVSKAHHPRHPNSHRRAAK